MVQIMKNQNDRQRTEKLFILPTALVAVLLIGFIGLACSSPHSKTSAGDAAPASGGRTGSSIATGGAGGSLGPVGAGGGSASVTSASGGSIGGGGAAGKFDTGGTGGQGGFADALGAGYCGDGIVQRSLGEECDI